MNLILTSPTGASASISAAFDSADHCQIQVREDGAFQPDHFLDLGRITLPGFGESDFDVPRALRNGEYEWAIPSKDTAAEGLRAAIGGTPSTTDEDKIRRIMDSLGGVAIRLGLTHPIFDPLALAAMPFRRPTTVVSDTSGVIQGGLSFVAQNLHPAARLKIPAVVQMEVVNSSDRFLSNRRKGIKGKKHDLLIDHINSQAAQRVLLKLELRSSVELERTLLVGDPLRAAFKGDEEKELRELNLNVPIRSYADRLILEAARQHQAQVSPGHQVLLLTSDQGLARMAIGEGLMPLYFHSAKADSLFGKIHSGSNLRPFDGQLVSTDLAEILWELATIFGTARLASPDGSALLTVRAIGDSLSWAPYHSHDDLLWVEGGNPSANPSAPPAPPIGNDPEPATSSGNSAARAESARGLRATINKVRSADAVDEQRTGTSSEISEADSRTPLYKMSVDSLLKLVIELDKEQSISESRVAVIIDSQNPTSLSDYRRFLSSSNALNVEGDTWIAGPGLRLISAALGNADPDALGEALSAIPAYAAIRQTFLNAPVGEPYPTKAAFKRAEATYLALAEATLLGAPVQKKGFYPTIARPTDEEFVPIAIKAYNKVTAEGRWASTGQWLEELIATDGVHPLIARLRLQSASERGLLERFFEGSTTDTKSDRHIIRVLAVNDGMPFLKTEYLYRGDFLMPGRGGSSLRVVEAKNEPA